MTEKREFLAPEYYEGFRCKMGACRAACGEGWPVDMSRRDYFRLESAECSREKLRQRIDRALRVLPRATPECYVRSFTDMMGNVPCGWRTGGARCMRNWERNFCPQFAGAIPGDCIRTAPAPAPPVVNRWRKRCCAGKRP